MMMDDDDPGMDACVVLCVCDKKIRVSGRRHHLEEVDAACGHGYCMCFAFVVRMASIRKLQAAAVRSRTNKLPHKKIDAHTEEHTPLHTPPIFGVPASLYVFPFHHPFVLASLFILTLTLTLMSHPIHTLVQTHTSSHAPLHHIIIKTNIPPSFNTTTYHTQARIRMLPLLPILLLLLSSTTSLQAFLVPSSPLSFRAAAVRSSGACVCVCMGLCFVFAYGLCSAVASK